MRVRNFWKLVSCAFFLALAGSNAWALPGGCAVGYDSNRMARNNVNIEGMGAPPGAKEELSPDVLSTLQAKMAEDFTTAVRNRYCIKKARYFLLVPVLSRKWVVVEHGMKADLLESRVPAGDIPWYRPGLDLLSVWRLGFFRREYFAFVMSGDAPPVVGYYELERQ